MTEQVVEAKRELSLVKDDLMQAKSELVKTKGEQSLVRGADAVASAVDFRAAAGRASCGCTLRAQRTPAEDCVYFAGRAPLMHDLQPGIAL